MGKTETDLRKEFADLLIAEYAYWRETTDESIQDFAMGAMGSVSNVLAAVLAGKSADTYRKDVAKRDARTRPHKSRK